MKYLLLSLALFATHVCLAQDRWTPEEIIHTKYVSNPSFSKDASMVVWSQREGLKEKDKFVSHLYLTRLNMMDKDVPMTVQLTRSEESDYNALFNKEGSAIYFLSSRDKGKKLWKLSTYGGEPEEVQEFTNGISSMDWLNDSTLIFVAGEGKTLYDITNEKDDTEVVEDTAHWNPKRLFTFDVNNKKTTRLTQNSYRISSYSVSKDGKYVIYEETTSPDYGIDGNPKPNYYLKNITSGEETRLFEGLQEPRGFQFTPDSKGFYFSATQSSNPEWNGAGIDLLYYYDLSTKSLTEVNLNWENGLSDFYLVGSNVLAELANGPYYKISYYHKNGTSWERSAIDLGDKQEHVSILAVSENGKKVLYTHSTASQLPEYYTANLASKKKTISFTNEQKFTSLNDALKKKAIAKSEVVYWKGANDDEVNGILYYPKNYEKGKKYPLILSIHGGPTGVDRDAWSERWSTYPQIYTDKGAFVLKPNYHGSGAHSLEFIESIKNGNYYSLEQIDIYNGIQHLNEKGMIDMDKLGTMGWSNGAILTTWMTLKYPDLFKVAAPGAGDINWTSDYGTCQFGVTFDQSYFGGAPWDDINGKHYNEWYINNSPIFEIEKIKTPTIIFHGSEDRAVPRDQGWENYRGLQQVGQTPVKFLWFPGQPHGLQKITHQLRKMKEEIAWIDQYLFREEKDENESFKEDSPLAAALKVDSARIDGLIGTMADDALLPPVIRLAKDSISIGMFEVTMAQYHASTGKDFDRLVANHPVTGLNKQQIDDYLKWLSTKTGKTYRLPNKAEAKTLHEKGRGAAKSQNNLNYWAGYELTLPDVGPLKKKLSTLQSGMIKSVGNFGTVKLSDEARVFDLGGNVAEYYLDGSELKVYDYSAYDFVDPMNAALPRTSVQVGFRVVVQK
ncbi:prolyl oligopeptidase family serine peptidase [Marinoscillum sp.]|uniref:prolyl oligopeptidase family serine peptidase n=1 Tax=Marinoscillum sp. TaxID=2024838 RepID=UPI003BA93022